MNAVARYLVPLMFFACGANETKLRPTPAPATQLAPIAVSANELFSCRRERDGAVAILAESNRLLRECQADLTPLRGERGQDLLAQRVLEPDEASHEGGWWCVESLAAQSASGCTRTFTECQGVAAEIRSTTLMVPGRCQWQPRAACFVLHAKLPNVTEEICSSLLSACDVNRQARRQQTRDYDVKSLCRALD